MINSTLLSRKLSVKARRHIWVHEINQIAEQLGKVKQKKSAREGSATYYWHENEIDKVYEMLEKNN